MKSTKKEHKSLTSNRRLRVDGIYSKAQMKTGETIIVLIIFFILLAGAMVFYAKIQTYTLAKKQEELQEQTAITLANRIRHLAEISCTIDGSVVFDCYDLVKLTALQKIVETSSLYYQLNVFHDSRVVVTSVYPEQEELVLYDFGSAEESTSALPFRIPVTIYDPRDGTYNFGYMTIEVYA